MIGAIADTKALGEVVLASLIAGVGVTVTFSLSIRGATRFAELRRAARPLEAAAYAGLAIAGLAFSVAGVVVGLIVMTSK